MTTEPYALVLGVAQDGGHPQAGCRRECCRKLTSKAHLTSCVAVIATGRAWLLDAGPDLPDHLRLLAAAGAKPTGVFVTHAHVGHYAGLIHLGREAMNTTAFPVWAAPRMAEYLSCNGPWEQLIAAGNIELQGLADPIELPAGLTVAPFPVPHRDEYSETVGFEVAGSRAQLAYVPDTDGWDQWDPPIENLIHRVDFALLDGTFFDHSELPERDLTEIDHPLVVDSLDRFAALDDAGRGKVRFTHLNHTNPLLDPASDASIRIARSGMRVATEGDVYEL